MFCYAELKVKCVIITHIFKHRLTHFKIIVIVRTVAMGESMKPTVNVFIYLPKVLWFRKLLTKNYDSFFSESNKKQ